jgi:hypothetical protein
MTTPFWRGIDSQKLMLTGPDALSSADFVQVDDPEPEPDAVVDDDELDDEQAAAKSAVAPSVAARASGRRRVRRRVRISCL